MLVTGEKLPVVKPCPFCGRGANLQHTHTTRDGMHGQRHWYRVVCTGDLNHGGTCRVEQLAIANNPRRAIELWNTRAKPKWLAVTPSVLDELRLSKDHGVLWLVVFFEDSKTKTVCKGHYRWNESEWHTGGMRHEFVVHHIGTFPAHRITHVMPYDGPEAPQ